MHAATRKFKDVLKKRKLMGSVKANLATHLLVANCQGRQVAGMGVPPQLHNG